MVKYQFALVAVTVVAHATNVSAKVAKVCPDYVAYVCAVKDGQSKTYVNSCFAKRDGAKHVKLGKCDDAGPTKFCPEIVMPVCATKDGSQKTYTNGCFALADGAEIQSSDACH